MDSNPSQPTLEPSEGTPLTATMWTPPTPDDDDVEAKTKAWVQENGEQPGLAQRLQQSAPVQRLKGAGEGLRDLAARHPVATASAAFALGLLVSESVRRYRR